MSPAVHESGLWLVGEDHPEIRRRFRASAKQTERMLHKAIAEHSALIGALLPLRDSLRQLNRATCLLVLADPGRKGELSHTHSGLMQDIQQQSSKIMHVFDEVLP